MAVVLITGSAAGLGRLAAESVLDGGDEVIVHGRDHNRLDTLRDLVTRARRPSSATSPRLTRYATSPNR